MAANRSCPGQASAPHLGAPGKLDAPGLRQVLVDPHEFWLNSKAAELGISADSGLAIVAVGGLGRGELLPFSDLDLILLHDDLPTATVSEVADGLWYPLWDANILPDHSVRTVPQALSVAAEDVTAALGLLEARHIAGDEDLSKLLIGGVRQQWRAQIRTRFPDVVAHAQDRWRRPATSRTAPNPISRAAGWPARCPVARALAIAQLDRRPVDRACRFSGSAPQTAYVRLLDIRTELHRIAGRPREQVRPGRRRDRCGTTDRGPVSDLARSISDAARTISYPSTWACEQRAMRCRGAVWLARRTPVRRPLDEGVVEHNGEVVLARNAIPSRDPGLILRVAASSAVRATDQRLDAEQTRRLCAGAARTVAEGGAQ